MSVFETLFKCVSQHSGCQFVCHLQNCRRTACHYAADQGHLEVVKLLLAYGTDTQLRDEVSITEVMRLYANG